MGVPIEGKVAQLGQVLGPDMVKLGQSSRKSPKIIQSEQIVALASLSGLVAQSFPKSVFTAGWQALTGINPIH